MLQTYKSCSVVSLVLMLLCADFVVVTPTTAAQAEVQDADALRDRLIEIDRQIEAGPPRPRGAALAVMYPEHMRLRNVDRYRAWLGVDDGVYRQWLTNHFAEYQQRVLRLQENLLVEAMNLGSELANEPGHNHTIETYTPLLKRMYGDLLLPYDRRLESAETEALSLLFADLPEGKQDLRMLALIEADRQRLRYQTPCMMPMSVTDLIAVLGQMNIDAFDEPDLREIAEAYVIDAGPARRKRFREELRVVVANAEWKRDVERGVAQNSIVARRNLRGPYVDSCMRLVRLNQQYTDVFAAALQTDARATFRQLVREHGFGDRLYDKDLEHRIRIFTEQVRDELELTDGQREVVDQFLNEFHTWYVDHQRKMEKYLIEHMEGFYSTMTMSHADMIAHDAKMNSLKAEVHVKFQHMTTEITDYLGMN